MLIWGQTPIFNILLIWGQTPFFNTSLSRERRTEIAFAATFNGRDNGRICDPPTHHPRKPEESREIACGIDVVSSVACQEDHDSMCPMGFITSWRAATVRGRCLKMTAIAPASWTFLPMQRSAT